MADVIEVDDRAQFPGFLEFVGRRIVRRKHDVFADNAATLGQNQLRQRTAIRADAFFPQHFQNRRIGGCLDREIFFELRRPRERRQQIPDILPDGRLIVNMERGRILTNDFR